MWASALRPVCSQAASLAGSVVPTTQRAARMVAAALHRHSTVPLTIRPRATTFNPMVDHSTLDTVFRAISDPTRRAMIASLARAPRTVGELARPFEISLAAASKHIQVLERAGLVRRTVKGRTHTVRLNAEPLRAGIDWMQRYEKFWGGRLDALERELRAEDAGATATSQRATADHPAPRGPRILPPHERPARRTPRSNES